MMYAIKRLIVLGLWALTLAFMGSRYSYAFPDDGYVRIGGQIFEASKIYGMREPKGVVPEWNQCIMVDRVHKECAVGPWESWQRTKHMLGLVVIDKRVATLYYVNLSEEGKALLIECYSKTTCSIRDFY